MVFVPLHCIPSFIAGILILSLTLKFSKQNHKILSVAIVFLVFLACTAIYLRDAFGFSH